MIIYKLHKYKKKLNSYNITMTEIGTKKGKEISNHLDSINMDPWYIIYGKYINPKSKN